MRDRAIYKIILIISFFQILLGNSRAYAEPSTEIKTLFDKIRSLVLDVEDFTNKCLDNDINNGEVGFDEFVSHEAYNSISGLVISVKDTFLLNDLGPVRLQLFVKSFLQFRDLMNAYYDGGYYSPRSEFGFFKKGEEISVEHETPIDTSVSQRTSKISKERIYSEDGKLVKERLRVDVKHPPNDDDFNKCKVEWARINNETATWDSVRELLDLSWERNIAANNQSDIIFREVQLSYDSFGNLIVPIVEGLVFIGVVAVTTAWVTGTGGAGAVAVIAIIAYLNAKDETNIKDIF